MLLANPVGRNGLTHAGLLSEAAKLFGLRGRRLQPYLDQDLSERECYKPALHLPLCVRFYVCMCVCACALAVSKCP